MGVLYPATDESLEDQIVAAQSVAHDDTAAMAVILRRFDGLAISIARSLTADRSRRDDAAQGARIGLVKAVRRHKVGTPGFPSYAKRYMRGEALRTLAATWGEETYVDPSDYESIINPTASHVLDTTIEFTDFVSVLRPEQQAIVKAVYIGDVALGVIAGALGITKPAVSQRLATIHRNLRDAAETAVAA